MGCLRSDSARKHPPIQVIDSIGLTGMGNRAAVTFHTSPEVKARLDRLATLTRRSKSFLTNEAVERYLAEEENFVAAVEEGLAEAKAGSSSTTTKPLPICVRSRLNRHSCSPSLSVHDAPLDATDAP
jgi:RHH-type transcriptional regulator, rel operon repressor / antitoxin RelB